jgi:hypothetical protein
MRVFLRDTYRAGDEDRVMPDDVVRDGESLRTPMVLMDADGMAGHRPGYAALTDEQVAQRRAARQRMIDRATSAWRGPQDAKKRRPPDEDADDDEADDRGRSRDARDAARVARQRMIDRATNAWRTPARDVAMPSLHTPPTPEQMMTRHVYGAEDPDDPVAKKQAAYEAYKNKLSNAWKSPAHEARRPDYIIGAGPTSMVVQQQGKTDPRRADQVEKQAEQWRGGK